MLEYFLVSPDHFGVEYSINPWMDGNIGKVDSNLAWKQWTRLKEKIETKAKVHVIPCISHLPDMVFTANAAIVRDKKALIASFTFPERQPETRVFGDFFQNIWGENAVSYFPEGITQEGAGDALWDRNEREKPLLWAGDGFRSVEQSYETVLQTWDCQVEILNLTHPEYYHIDISLAPLDGGFLMYAPQSFDDISVAKIEKNTPKEKRILLSQEDLDAFNGNAVNLGDLVIVNNASDKLQKDLHNAGYKVWNNDISEFKKAGGGNKCLTLRLE